GAVVPLRELRGTRVRQEEARHKQAATEVPFHSHDYFSFLSLFTTDSPYAAFALVARQAALFGSPLQQRHSDCVTSHLMKSSHFELAKIGSLCVRESKKPVVIYERPSQM